MEKTDKKILFITPAAQSTGANIFLLRFFYWLKENSKIPFVTLYGYGEDLEKEFGELSKTFKYLSEDKKGNALGKVFGKISKRYGLRRASLKSQIKRENIGLIYSNTVVNHEMLSMFEDWDVPVITHCHELESVIQFYGIDEFGKAKNLTTHFITVSRAAKDNLIENHTIPPDNISLVYGFIPIKEFSEKEKESKKKAVCKELHIPENAFIVGASGTLDWRKAPEIFIKTVENISEKMPDAPIYFVWVGGASKGNFSHFAAKFDVEKLNLKRRVFFLVHKPNPLDYFAATDVFAMVSREDPFPLVCLEAASLGKPIICFENAGGMPEFVKDDSGFVIPYLDIEAMANKVIELYENPQLKNEMGERAAAKVKKDHDILKSAPKILEIIESFLSR